MKEHIYILILNWNGNKILKNCLESISKIEYSNFSTIVIDNASTDNSIEIIQDYYPEVEIFKLNKNYGFSKGYNRCFEYLKKKNKEYILLLNNDTEVHPGILNNFMDGVHSYGRNEIFGGKIFYRNNKMKIWYAGGKINLKYFYISHIGIRKKNSEKYSNSSKTDYITGCCLFTSWDTIEKLDGFDSNFTMYGEDVDLCLRAKEQNINCYYLPDVKLWHHVSSSIGGNWSKRKIIMKLISIIKLWIKHCFLNK